MQMSLVPIIWPVTQTVKSTVTLWTSLARKRQVKPVKTPNYASHLLNYFILIFFEHLPQNSEHNRSVIDTDDEENHVPQPLEDSEDFQGPPQVIRCGGEDGETTGSLSHRHKLNADKDRSLIRRGRGNVACSLSVFSWNILLKSLFEMCL